MGREHIKFLVDSDMSFYQDFVPAPWKQALIRQLGPSLAQHIDEPISDEMILLLVEAITEEVPWFAEVVSKDKKAWVRSELELVRKDVKTALGKS